MPVRAANSAIRSGPASTIVSPSAPSSTSSLRQSTSAAPGMWPAAWTSGAVPSGRQRRSRTRIAGPAEILGEPFRRGEELRAGQATHGRYHTGRGGPLPARSGEAGGGPHGDPVAGRRHLPQHRLGRAAARRDGRRDGRHGQPTSATSAAPTSTTSSSSSDRMDEARAGVAAVLGTDVGAVALTHATTDGMNAATLLPDWRAGGRAVTTAHEHAGRDSARSTRCATGTASTSRSSTRATTATTTRTIAAFDAAITADTRLVSISHVLWTTGAVMPVRAIAEIAHDRGALVVVDGAQAAGAIRLPARGPRRRPVRRRGPEVAARTGGDGCARRRPGRRSSVSAPSLGGWFSFETVDGTGGATWWPDARRFESTGYHRPSVVGMARSIGWLSMFVGLDFVQRRGRRDGRRRRRPPGVDPGRDRPHAAPCDGDAGDVPHRRLAGRGRARRARLADLRSSRGPSRASTRSA